MYNYPVFFSSQRKESLKMDRQRTLFTRLLLLLLVVLYLVSIGVFTYANGVLEPEHVPWMIAANTAILSLPLVLFYGSLFLLLVAWLEHRQTGQIHPRLARFLHRAPRVAAIAIIFFVSLFSLDVFGMDGTPLQLVGAFILHSLPALVMILLLVVAWKRPVVGFVTFLLAGLFFLRFIFFTEMGFLHFLLFSGPLLLISALFYADWRWLKPPAAAAA
jgi:hypothetical protein